jgi:hypothetical protein
MKIPQRGFAFVLRDTKANGRSAATPSFSQRGPNIDKQVDQFVDVLIAASSRRMPRRNAVRPCLIIGTSDKDLIAHDTVDDIETGAAKLS